MRALMRVGQQGCVDRALGTLTTNVFCNQETFIQDFISNIRLMSTFNHSVKFHLRLSGDHKTVVSGVTERVEAAVRDWIPFKSQLCSEN